MPSLEALDESVKTLEANLGNISAKFEAISGLTEKINALQSDVEALKKDPVPKADPVDSASITQDDLKAAMIDLSDSLSASLVQALATKQAGNEADEKEGADEDENKGNPDTIDASTMGRSEYIEAKTKAFFEANKDLSGEAKARRAQDMHAELSREWGTIRNANN